MKEIIKGFAKDHPFLTYFTITGVVSSIANAVVGVARAVTNNYPPAVPIKFDAEPDTEDQETPEIVCENPEEIEDFE